MLVGVDDERLKAALSETALAVVVKAAEEFSRIFQQFERPHDGLSGFGEYVIFILGEAFLEYLDLVGELAHLGVEQVDGPVRVADEFEELALLLLEAGSFELESAAQALIGLLPLVRVGIDHLVNRPDGRFWDLQCGVVVLDSGLHLRSVQSGQVTGFIADADAQEVEVDAAARVLPPVEVHHAAAPPAGQQTLERVVVDPFPSPRATLRVEHVLHFVEQLLVDQRLVPSGVFLAFVGDEAEVVPVLQCATDLGDGDGPTGRVLLARARPQSRFGERLPQLGEGVFAGSVELEHHLDVGRSFVVELDRVDLAPVDLDGDVAVAELRSARRAAVLGLGLHLERDVGSGCSRLVFVDRVEDRADHLAHVGVIGVVLDRDQRDA